MIFKAMTLKEASDLYDIIQKDCVSLSMRNALLDDLIFFTDNFERDYGTPPKKVKYYGEIYEKLDGSSYIVQSNWFDKAEQVEDWFETIDFIHDDFGKRIMCAEWDETADCYGDIEIYKEVL